MNDSVLIAIIAAVASIIVAILAYYKDQVLKFHKQFTEGIPARTPALKRLSRTILFTLSIIIVAVIIFRVLGVPTREPRNLVVNGGFEESTLDFGWVFDPKTMRLSSDSRTGDQALLLEQTKSLNDDDPWAIAKQYYEGVEVGQIYSATFWLKWTDISSLHVGIRCRDAQDNVVCEEYTPDIEDTRPAGGWVLVEVEPVTVTLATVKLEFFVGHGVQDLDEDPEKESLVIKPGIVYVDDVTLILHESQSNDEEPKELSSK